MKLRCRISSYIMAILIVSGCSVSIEPQENNTSNPTNSSGNTSSEGPANNTPDETMNEPSTEQNGEGVQGEDNVPVDDGTEAPLTPTTAPSSGSFFLGGVTDGDIAGTSNGSLDGFFTAYDSTGTILLNRQFGSTGNDVVTTASSSTVGFYATAGYTDGAIVGSSSGGEDGFVVLYDSSGALVFRRQIGTNADERVGSVAFTSSGDVVAVGNTAGALSGTAFSASDVFVRLYDSQGQILFTRQFGSANSDVPKSISISADNLIAIAGETDGALVGSNTGSTDAFVRVMDTDGQIVFTRQFGSAGAESVDKVHALPDGGYVVIGETDGALSGASTSSQDMYLRVYEADGSIRFTRQFGSPDIENYGASSIFANGNIAIAGDTTGVISGGANLGQEDVFLRVYNSQGDVVLTRQYGSDGSDTVSDIAVDAELNVVMVGQTSGSISGSSSGESDAYVRKYDLAGRVIFTRQFGSPDAETNTQVKVASNNGIFIGGNTNGALSGASRGGLDIYLRGYDSTGTILFTRQTGSDGNDELIGLSAY